MLYVLKKKNTEILTLKCWVQSHITTYFNVPNVGFARQTNTDTKSLRCWLQCSMCQKKKKKSLKFNVGFNPISLYISVHPLGLHNITMTPKGSMLATMLASIQKNKQKKNTWHFISSMLGSIPHHYTFKCVQCVGFARQTNIMLLLAVNVHCSTAHALSNCKCSMLSTSHAFSNYKCLLLSTAYAVFTLDSASFF